MKKIEQVLLFSSLLICILLTVLIYSSNLWAINNVQITNTPWDERYPQISMKDNLIGVVWNVPTKDSVYFAKSADNGKNWSSSLAIGRGDSASIAISDNGYIYIVWHSNGEIIFRKSIDFGLRFEDPILVGNGFCPDIAVDYHGNLYIVWQKNIVPGGHVCFSKSINFGDTFSEPLLLAKKPIYWTYPPKIAVNPSGNNVYIVWVSEPQPGEHIRVYFSKSHDGGLTFGPWIQPTAFKQHGEHNPDIEAYGENNVYIVWTLDQYNCNHIYIAISTDGGENWNPRIRQIADEIDDGDYTSTDAYEPSIAIDKNGYIYVSWIGLINDYEVGDIFIDKSIDEGGAH